MSNLTIFLFLVLFSLFIYVDLLRRFYINRMKNKIKGLEEDINLKLQKFDLLQQMAGTNVENVEEAELKDSMEA